MKTHYSMKEAAEELRVTQPTLRKHLRRMGIQAYAIGADHRSRYITRDELERLRKWINKELLVINNT